MCMITNNFTVPVTSIPSSSELIYSEAAMIENFEGAYEELTRGIAGYALPEAIPIPADRWIVSSLLQKAIRRGEASLAEQAALALHKMHRTAVFRRLMDIACTDVGAAEPGTLVKTVLAAESPQWRKRAGGDARAAAYLARIQAEAPKDRSAAYLISAAQNHPALDPFRRILESRPPSGRLELAADGSLSLLERSAAIWCASGIGWGAGQHVSSADILDIFSVSRHLGVSPVLAHACGYAALRTRQAVCLMPLLLSLAVNASAARTVKDCPVPSSPEVDGVPLWCLDRFTRMGKQAIQTFAQENGPVRSCLDEHVPESRHGEAAGTALFYAEGYAVSRLLRWKSSNALAALGIRSDMLVSGVPSEGMKPLLNAVRENLDHLNTIRARLFTASRQDGGCGLGLH